MRGMVGAESAVYHCPVLLRESVEWLLGGAGGLSGSYIDMTLGGGGHSRAILEALAGDGRLYCVDRDADALVNAPRDPRVCTLHANYRHTARWMDYLGQGPVDGVLLDLGVSLHHLKVPARGFSFRASGPLDMRMHRGGGSSAGEWLAAVGRGELARVLREYGELRDAWAIAGAIVAAREVGALTDTLALRDAVLRAPVRRQEEAKVLSCVFQAIRIEVNGELRGLAETLHSLASLVAPGGRVVVISYHSLEDRLVKRYLRDGWVEAGQGEQAARGEGELPEAQRRREALIYGGRGPSAPFRELTRRVVVPSAAEVAANGSARSARMRVGERAGL